MSNLWFDAALLLITIGCLLSIHISKSNKLRQESLIQKDPWNRPRKPSSILYPINAIRQSGIINPSTQLLYWPIKTLSTLMTAIFLTELPSANHHVAIIALCCLFAFFNIDLILLKMRKNRQQKIVNGLGFFIELIIAQLKSGSSLYKSIEFSSKVGFLPNHPLAIEVDIMNKELKAGRSFPNAFNALAKRTGVKELIHISSILNIGIKMGAPILNTLIQHSKTLKDKQDELMAKKLNKKNIEMLLPMAISSLPMFFVLVLFPASVQVIDILRILKDII